MYCYNLFKIFRSGERNFRIYEIGVISDTHLNGVTRELEDIFENYLYDMDAILHAGDHVTIEVVEFLEKMNFTVSMEIWIPMT